MSFFKDDNQKIKLILLHILIGLVVFLIKPTSVLINLLMIAFFVLFVLKTKDKTYAILISCAYIAMSDVFFRMTKGLVFYELHKYLLIVFVLIGFAFQFNKTRGKIYLLYIGLLLIGIIFTNYDYEDEVRKMIAFNLGGPVSLGIVALYFYKKKIPLSKLVNVLFYGLLPVVSLTVYLFLFTPSVKDVVTGTHSNFTTSGGFGPNQVATVLGAGMFILISRLVLSKPRNLLFFIELFLLILVTYRGLVTFSRGGIITGIIAGLFFILFTYNKAKLSMRVKLIKAMFVFVFLGVVIWGYALVTTSGLIENRYANKNAIGQEKKDISTGRSTLIQTELEAFLEHPFVGIGVGKNKQYRYENTGIEAASHNEISRLLAEHGTLGIIAFFIIFFTPLIFRLENKNNIYFYSFFLLWFLTINHSSMRIAFPSFIYGLALLDVTYETKNKKVAKSQIQSKHSS